MADSNTRTMSSLAIKVFEGGSWADKSVSASSIADLRIALNVPTGASINIDGTVYSDATAAVPAGATNADGTTRPLFVAWQSNTKTGGK